MILFDIDSLNKIKDFVISFYDVDSLPCEEDLISLVLDIYLTIRKVQQ